MANNKLYDKSEIESLNYKKIKGLKKVAITGDYNDLDNIPDSFPPAEHTASHTKVSSTENGMMTKEVKKKLDEFLSWKNIELIQDNSLGKSDNTTLINKIIISSSDTLNITSNEKEKTITFTGVELDTSSIIIKKGDKGESGKDGKEGYIWIPTIDSNSYVSWTLIKNPIANGDAYKSFNITGLIGFKGEDGLQVMLCDITDNPYKSGTNGNVACFNYSKKITSKPICTTLSSSYSLALYGFYKDRLAEIYGNKFSLVYSIDDMNFYSYNSVDKSYNVLNENTKFTDVFTLNSFIYEENLDTLFYISTDKKFIPVV